jgi:hypothetical protein
MASPLEPKKDRIKEDLLHEVLPVDIDPAPEINEARGQHISMVALGHVEAK